MELRRPNSGQLQAHLDQGGGGGGWVGGFLPTLASPGGFPAAPVDERACGPTSPLKVSGVILIG